MAPDLLSPAMDDALAAARATSGGQNTRVYPSLRDAPGDAFAAAALTVDGVSARRDDARPGFILMSVAKPFALALAAERVGAEAVIGMTGMRETGLAFNDPAAIEAGPAGRTNPMVNPGAITVASLLTERALRDGLSAFAGRALDADTAMVEAIHATNARNRLLAGMLADRGLLGAGVEDALHLYTYQSCVGVTAADLARMGAVLAAAGRDPVTGARVVGAEAARLAVDAMALAGLYEATAGWMGTVGLPAKSGIAGGLVMVAPGRGAFAAYSPPLDPAGNPVRAQAAARAFASVWV